jgi:hypothetical protein
MEMEKNLASVPETAVPSNNLLILETKRLPLSQIKSAFRSLRKKYRWSFLEKRKYIAPKKPSRSKKTGACAEYPAVCDVVTN